MFPPGLFINAIPPPIAIVTTGKKEYTSTWLNTLMYQALKIEKANYASIDLAVR